MPDYRSDDSIPEKRRIIEEAYGDTVPGSLLFHLGKTTRLTDDEKQMLNGTFFQDRQPGFGDEELHNSHGYTGSKMWPPHKEIKPFIVLRIRDATRMAYSLQIGGETCHLIQVTNGDNSKPLLNFLEIWGASPLDELVGDDSVPSDRQPAFAEYTVATSLVPSD